MTNYDDRGRVSLWKPESDHPKSPILSGTLCAHRDIREGETVFIGLWKSTSDHPNAPILIGKLTDPREKKESKPPPPPPPPVTAEDFVDDDLPF
jgi:hypothetical protein